MAYQFKVMSDLCLWNGKYRIVVESCLVVLRTAFSLGGVRCAEEEVTETDRQTQTDTHTQHTHTHTHTHTHYQQSLVITQQQSSTQCHNCVAVFSVDWLQEEGEVLKVKYWLYSWKRSKQTKWKNRKTISKRGYKNRLQTVTDKQQDKTTSWKLSLTHNRI